MDDQKKIGAFGVGTNILLELKEKRDNIQKILDGIEDAEQELMLCEDELENVKIKLGGVYIHMGEDEYTEHFDNLRTSCESELEVLNEDIKQKEASQDILKKELYERFGDQINLEY